MGSFAYLNRVQIIGNVVADPEIKQTNTGTALAIFSVATNRSYKNSNDEWEDVVEYHNCIAWLKLAELAEKLLKKGSKVYVEGRMETKNWEKEGVKHYRTEIIVQNFIVLSKKDSEN